MGQFGDNYGPNYDLVTVSVPAKPVSVSHTTLDAGVDLRKRKSNQRQTQILKLSVEIPCTGSAKRTETIPIKATGTAKITGTISLKAKATAKVTQSEKVDTDGSAISRQFTAVDVQGEKSSQMFTLTKQIKTQRKFNTLMEALRQIDKEDEE